MVYVLETQYWKNQRPQILCKKGWISID
jgi:hypothetical protein